VGPDRPGHGRMWGCEWAPPAGARRLLLAGDESAVPAVCAVLEALPDGTDATALLEVPTAHDELAVPLPDGVTLRWLSRSQRNGTRPHGDLLVPAVRDTVAGWVTPVAATTAPDDVDVDTTILWDVADADASRDGVYAWVAGEAAVVRALRRHLLGHIGLPRGSAAFMGYWRLGRAEQN
jgi:NADPH-dependent ferric siderophore reductase